MSFEYTGPGSAFTSSLKNWSLSFKESNFPFYFSHLSPKSLWSVLQVKFESGGKMKSRCTVFGISVAESYEIPGTRPDSYSMLLSARHPASPEQRPSARVTPPAQTDTTAPYSMFDRL